MCQDMSGLFYHTPVDGLYPINVKHTYSEQSINGLINVPLIFMRINRGKTGDDNCTSLIAVTSITVVLCYMVIGTRRSLAVNSLSV
jgi:hypothetical protein